jgi:tetratricopeptide (TPR) repeat protein
MVTSSDIIFYRYSPENMDKTTLQKLFVGRGKLFESLFSEIENVAKKNTPRFYLILGPRGIGKSHFLVLLYYEIQNKLNSLLIPIKLAEEEYSVIRISDLFLRILEEKSENILDILSLNDEDEILEAALEKLNHISKKDRKRYVIFIENLHELFNQLDTKELQKLRAIFQKNETFSILSTAPMIFPAISDHEEPFYNFFEIIHLKEFSLSEIMELIQKIAEVEGNWEFIEDFKKYEPKIHGMSHLTGGSPRLVILFYEMMTKGELENVEKAFLKIIDEQTPYYQEIFQLLPTQPRRIFDILISLGSPVTPKQISENARIKLPTVTTQLRRLEKDGYIISRPMGRNTYYEVRERLFRLWREMRQPFGRKRVSILLEFLQLWYTPEEQKQLFKSKFELLESGERKVIKDLCYLAEILPLESKIEAFLQLTSKLLELGELEEAEYEIRRLKETETQIKDKTVKINILLYEGELLFYKKKYKDALVSFNNVLERNPTDHFALFRKGTILRNLGRLEEALEAFDKALEINPKNEFSLSMKGITLGDLGRYEEALKPFDEAIGINPKNDFVLSWKGAALGSLSRHEEALEAFNKALEIDPKDEFTLSRKGFALRCLGRHEEALEAFNKALEINPKDEFSLSLKGDVLIELDRYEEALKSLNKALEMNQKDEFSLLRKGVALGSLGRHEEALEAFNKALEIDPKDEFTLSKKGIALRFLSRYEESLETFSKALEINPHSEYVLRGFIYASFDFAIKELKDGNHGNASRLVEVAYNRGTELKADDLDELTISFLKNAAKTGDYTVIKTVVDEVIKLKGDDYHELIKPIIKALEIAESKDIQRYYSLQVEEREIVADIVKMITRSDELVPDEIKRKEGLKPS